MRLVTLGLLVLAGCVVPDLDLSGRRCDATHPCTSSWICIDGTCETCAGRDEDEDGERPRACGGRDCDDTQKDVHPGALEVCANGLDDDCNGAKDGADPACQCVVGATRPCEGTCAGSFRRCIEGVWGDCAPPDEACDGDDDDCDGAKDDGFECALGSTVSCTTTCGSAGERVCGAGCRLGPCVAPAETCNGLDDDCTGGPDNGYPCIQSSTSPCTTSCGTTGVATCELTCNHGRCVPPAEVCNGRDEDCRGGPDDAFFCVLGRVTTSSPLCTTSCGSSGRRACGPTCEAFDGDCVPPSETCNGADDDCVNGADDGFACVLGESEPCTTTCGSTGQATCQTGCVPGACVAPVEACNGADDDCTNGPDDTFFCTQGRVGSASPACTTSCGTEGRRACNFTCTAFDGECLAPSEVCNGVDDDCSGGADEGLTGSAQPGSDGAVLSAAVGARLGVVARAIIVTRGDVAQVELEIPGHLTGRLVIASRLNAAPRDVEVAVGQRAVLVAWVNDAPTPAIRYSIVGFEGTRITADAALDTILAQARPRVAWSPAQGGRFGVSWISSGRARVATFDETGSAVLGTRSVGGTLSTAARVIGLAGRSNGAFVVATPTEGSASALKTEIVELSATGVESAAVTLTSTSSGVMRDDGLELSSVGDELAAAWILVRTVGTSDVRTVVATRWIGGLTPDPATAISPLGAAVAGGVRVAAQPGGVGVLWYELRPGLEAALVLARRTGTSGAHTRRVDEATATWVPTLAEPGPLAFDGLTWHVAWVDGEKELGRRVCP